jgi:hypothetical protein
VRMAWASDVVLVLDLVPLTAILDSLRAWFPRS